MRNFIWLVPLLANIGIIALYAPGALSGDMIASVVTILFGLISALLIAARFGRVPPGGYVAMKVTCISVPLVAIVGSLDAGKISGLEFYAIVIAMLFSWATWKTFLLCAPTRTSPINPDTV